MKKIKLETCEFVPVSSLVPKKWANGFWDVISENAPFSWGDNNRSLITAEVFADHCQNRDLEDYASEKEVERFMKTLRGLGQTYIDLEN